MYSEKAEKKKKENLKKKLQGPEPDKVVFNYINTHLRHPYSERVNPGKLWMLGHAIDELKLWTKSDAIKIAFDILMDRAKSKKVSADNIHSMLFDINALFMCKEDGEWGAGLRRYLRKFYKNLPNANEVMNDTPDNIRYSDSGRRTARQVKVHELPVLKIKVGILAAMMEGWQKHYEDAEASFVFISEAYNEIGYWADTVDFYYHTRRAIDELFRKHLSTGRHWWRHELDPWITYNKSRYVKRPHIIESNPDWKVVDRENWTLKKKDEIQTSRDIVNRLSMARARHGEHELPLKELPFYGQYNMHDRSDVMNEYAGGIFATLAKLDKAIGLVVNHINSCVKDDDIDTGPFKAVSMLPGGWEIRFEEGRYDTATIWVPIDPFEFRRDDKEQEAKIDALIQNFKDFMNNNMPSLDVNIDIRKRLPRGGACRG